LKDPALIAEAAKIGLDMTYRPPDELLNLARALYDTPRAIVDEAQEMMPANEN